MQATLIARFLGLLITLQTLNYAASASTKQNDPNPIKYPGPVQETSNRYGGTDADTSTQNMLYNLTVPTECKGKNFCLVKPPDYPQAQFNKMFEGFKPLEQPTLILDDLADRQGDPSWTDGCEPRVSYQPLYQVKSMSGDWRTVIQAAEENYVQKIRLEECKDTTSRCFTAFPELGIKTRCKQTVARWEVLVAGGSKGSEHIQTDLPICCSCVYYSP